MNLTVKLQVQTLLTDEHSFLAVRFWWWIITLLMFLSIPTMVVNTACNAFSGVSLSLPPWGGGRVAL